MSNPRDVSKISESRRDFLRGTLTASAGLAAVAMTPKGVAAVAEGAEAPEKAAGSKGYRATQHVLDYYKSASI